MLSTLEKELLKNCWSIKIGGKRDECWSNNRYTTFYVSFEDQEFIKENYWYKIDD